MRAAPLPLWFNHLSTTNRTALMAAPNNLRSRIPMNLRGRMSVSYSKVHNTAPQDDSQVETCGRGFSAYATCCALQPFVARRCKERGFGVYC